MTSGPVQPGRRRFLAGLLRKHVVEPALLRREHFGEVYESELRAFGPEVLADIAERTGLAAEDADYTRIAKALAGDMTKLDDESI